MASTWPVYKFCDDRTVMLAFALVLGHEAFYIFRTTVTELSTLISTSVVIFKCISHSETP